jgi:hypothetical protein
MIDHPPWPNPHSARHKSNTGAPPFVFFEGWVYLRASSCTRRKGSILAAEANSHSPNDSRTSSRNFPWQSIAADKITAWNARSSGPRSPHWAFSPISLCPSGGLWPRLSPSSFFAGGSPIAAAAVNASVDSKRLPFFAFAFSLRLCLRFSLSSRPQWRDLSLFPARTSALLHHSTEKLGGF